ncbi:MAG: type I-E CRISPR-associated protein Cas7/Cse4/CasC [Deltaproteobacteria bacterium]|nr:type I-E CRISPR-associated protein Cas7/Cse4/CasC [Deltaproteobacteria bacterium]
MFIELHMLQNFAPSCLNRDDTNSPKDCEFGGYRRARISSQCIKRSIRQYFKNEMRLPVESLAKRTKRLVDEVTKRLEEAGIDPSLARKVVETALSGWGLGVKEEGKTEYLLSLGENEIASLASACQEYWDVLVQVVQAAEDEAPEGEKAKKNKKKLAKAAIPEEFKKIMGQILDGGKAVDLALFGRMLADLPEKNIDAACQVAHAISTHKISMDFDFYTAVDDLNPKETAGAGMMGTIEFNSACFYRYANIDMSQLQENLGGDQDLSIKAVDAFLRAAAAAIPTGKQNSMAAQNPPSFILGVVRQSGLWSLANAFVEPVRPDQKGNLIQKSVTALENYWEKLATAYGEKGILLKSALAIDNELQKLQDHQVENLEALVTKVMDVIRST